MDAARQCPFELVDALARDRRDGVELELAALGVGGEFLELGGIRGVDLCRDDDRGLLGQGMLVDILRAGLCSDLFISERLLRGSGDPRYSRSGDRRYFYGETGELVRDDAEVFDGIGTARGVGHVDEMGEHAGALNVAQELDAEAGAEMRAFNQSGHVGDDEGLLVGLLADRDHAEIGLEGGEGIVGDFGARGGDAGDERGLAGVGIADEADVGEQLEFETIAALLAGAAQFVLARSLVGAGGEVLVATAAAATARNRDALVGLA